jgi:chromosome condensin MukBEF MukE localization factor
MEKTAMASGDPGLRWFARRASADAFFLGSALAEYQAMHGIDDRKLAETLRCTIEALARLGVCRRPDDQAAKFREEVQRIATFVSCNAERLVRLLREVAAVASLREGGSEASSQGLLMAARDRRSSGEPPERTADKKRSKRERKE